jgi:hypothetical protein
VWELADLSVAVELRQGVAGPLNDEDGLPLSIEVPRGSFRSAKSRKIRRGAGLTRQRR